MPSHEPGNSHNTHRDQLIQDWQRLFRCPVPKGMSTKLLARAVAYQTQAKELGGLSPPTKRHLLKQLQTEGSVRRSKTLRPGTRLIREWNGRKHTVDVLDKGFAWNGSVYPSLSAIARDITGARWSGPRFFGL